MFNPNQLTLTNINEMEVQEFIKKWNVAFEDKEQEMLFASQMEADLKSLQQVKPSVVLVCCSCEAKGADEMLTFCPECSGYSKHIANTRII